MGTIQIIGILFISVIIIAIFREMNKLSFPKLAFLVVIGSIFSTGLFYVIDIVGNTILRSIERRETVFQNFNYLDPLIIITAGAVFTAIAMLVMWILNDLKN